MTKYYGKRKVLTEIPLLPPVHCCGDIIKRDVNVRLFFTTQIKGEKGEKEKIVKIADFPIISVTDCSIVIAENSDNKSNFIDVCHKWYL